MNVLRELFDTPAERREFLRHVLIGLVTALVAVYVAKHSRLI